MFLQYNADAEKVANLLSIPLHFDLEIYTTSRQERVSTRRSPHSLQSATSAYFVFVSTEPGVAAAARCGRGGQAHRLGGVGELFARDGVSLQRRVLDRNQVSHRAVAAHRQHCAEVQGRIPRLLLQRQSSRSLEYQH